MDAKQLDRLGRSLVDNVARVIIGKQDQVSQVLCALLAETHVLLDDVPGLGKTMLARAFARSLDVPFARIQFTPDLLPSDVTGLSYFNQQRQQFEFRPGPVMAGVVLADEINRATPRTQSSLLEAMQERQVTVDGETRLLMRPFIVLATQNPVEMEGTFPLPEAQLDRFGLCIALGYPTLEDEAEIIARHGRTDPLSDLAPVTSIPDIIAAQNYVRQIYAGRDTINYLLSVVRATRERPDILLGASPRASLTLFRCGQALAAIRSRGYMLPEDIRTLAASVLAHRLVLRSRAQLRGHTATEMIGDVLSSVPVPVERDRGGR